MHDLYMWPLSLIEAMREYICILSLIPQNARRTSTKKINEFFFQNSIKTKPPTFINA